MGRGGAARDGAAVGVVVLPRCPRAQERWIHQRRARSASGAVKEQINTLMVCKSSFHTLPDKRKVCFYIALYPVLWTAQSALHFPPLADLFIPTPFSASPGSILARQQLHNDYSLTFPPLSIARYSFIQLSELRRRACPKLEQHASGAQDFYSYIVGNYLVQHQRRISLFAVDHSIIALAMCNANSFNGAHQFQH